MLLMMMKGNSDCQTLATLANGASKKAAHDTATHFPSFECAENSIPSRASAIAARV